MKLLLATNNKHKVAEIRAILSPRFGEILTLADANIDIDVVEDKDTFLGNALKKAKEICEASNLPSLADDSGLCVNALNGEPNVHSARYAGEDKNDEKNIDLLLKNLKNSPDRSAYFITVVVLYYPDGTYVAGEGRVYGEITQTRKGAGGFGYDPVFFCPELNKTFAEASFEEKNAVSHRRRALENLTERLI